jgi:hypothetical protein
MAGEAFQPDRKVIGFLVWLPEPLALRTVADARQGPGLAARFQGLAWSQVQLVVEFELARIGWVTGLKELELGMMGFVKSTGIIIQTRIRSGVIGEACMAPGTFLIASANQRSITATVVTVAGTAGLDLFRKLIRVVRRPGMTGPAFLVPRVNVGYKPLCEQQVLTA